MTTHSHTHSLSLSLSAFLLLVGRAAAQQRTAFVFHVYVDPIHGDNGSAWEMDPGNPDVPSLATFCRFGGIARPMPLASRDSINAYNGPHLPTNDNYSLTGNLQHAPYPFRTLTGDLGALAYVNAVFDDTGTPGQNGPVLPWSNGSLTVTHVIIHCLPGLYGPRQDGLAEDEMDIEPVSGLPWNGEQFPVELGEGPAVPGRLRLWNNVSIQGTSALDTIFDGRSNDPAPNLSPNTRSSDIFRVWSGPISTDNQKEAFIDGITIRNAGSVADATNVMHGAGIHIVGNSQSIRLRVTNCFFLGNVAGIVLDAFSSAQQSGIHRPLLVNNTFVNNQVGIWSGELTRDTPGPTTPYVQNHAPIVINDILLAPLPPPLSSCFEGLAPQVLLINRVDGMSIVSRDFNGWLPANTHFGFVPSMPNWGLASLGWGGSLPPLPAPGVDLTGLANLFVRDLLAGAGISDDPHDYRLSPFVSNGPAISPGAMVPLAPNPLLGAGVNRAQPNPPYAGITNQAGNGFSYFPGLPAGVEEVPVHGWDWDCEGLGNQRLLPRNGIMPNPLPPFGTVDIGADQCGGLIMAGYIPSTRLVACQNPSIGLTGYDRLFYVEQPNTAGFPRPDSSWRLGLLPWFANVEAPPVAEPLPCPTSAPFTFYTEGAWDPVAGLYSPRTLAYILGTVGPTPRHLACDFGPTLLADVHGFWDDWMTRYVEIPFPPWHMPDPYATNPIYHSYWQEINSLGMPVGPTRAGFFPDNGALFHNRNYTDAHGHATWDFQNGQQTWVWDAHINPPGTLILLGADDQFILPSGLFGPFGPCPAAYATGTWGLNDMCPDILPLLGLDLGLRVNCEIPRSRSLTAANTNLQTFLILANCGGGASSASQMSSMASASLLPLSVRLQLASQLNLPPELGTEAEFTAYTQAIISMAGGGQ